MMDWPLYTFLAFIATVVILAVLFMRSAIGQSLLTVASLHAKTYALAYVKCGLLMSLAMIGSFKETFHAVTSIQADSWTWWQWVIAFSNQIGAACAVMVAFLDKSLQRVDDARNQKPTP